MRLFFALLPEPGLARDIDVWRQRNLSADGRPVPMANFEPAERSDLAMRGLIGLVPLVGLEPGLRRIEVVWNPNAAEEGAPLDDRYTQVNSRYVIPIAFAPGFEMSLD